MNYIFRFFSMNFFKVSCSDTKKKPTEGCISSFKLILRLEEQ